MCACWNDYVTRTELLSRHSTLSFACTEFIFSTHFVCLSMCVLCSQFVISRCHIVISYIMLRSLFLSVSFISFFLSSFCFLIYFCAFFDLSPLVISFSIFFFFRFVCCCWCCCVMFKNFWRHNFSRWCFFCAFRLILSSSSLLCAKCLYVCSSFGCNLELTNIFFTRIFFRCSFFLSFSCHL